MQIIGFDHFNSVLSQNGGIVHHSFFDGCLKALDTSACVHLTSAEAAIWNLSRERTFENYSGTHSQDVGFRHFSVFNGSVQGLV